MFHNFIYAIVIFVAIVAFIILNNRDQFTNTTEATVSNYNRDTFLKQNHRTTQQTKPSCDDCSKLDKYQCVQCDNCRLDNPVTPKCVNKFYSQ